MAPANRRVGTLFRSRALVIVAVPWHWTVALKFARFRKHDPADIVAVLRLVEPPFKLGASTVQWTAERLEAWLRYACPGMQYDRYLPSSLHLWREHMRRAVLPVEEAREMSEHSQPQPPPCWRCGATPHP